MSQRPPRIGIRRVYEPVEADGAARILIDRLWPRGLSRESLHLAAWIPEVAPSTSLRKWFSHDPAKWAEFTTRYREELAANDEAVNRCLAWCRKGPVVLLFGTREREHNHAAVLRDYLEARLTSTGGSA